MASFRQRSYQKELLDGDHLPFADIRRNMQELDVINRRLGGHRITCKGLSVLRNRCKINSGEIVEIGCGGGDNLRALKAWAEARKLSFRYTGIDINPECIAFARSEKKNSGISFIHSDYREVNFAQKPAVIFSSLFCHHFTEPELVWMIRWMRQQATAGFFINDLHRHPLAYHSIKMLTRLFSKSYLVKNDAPLSVKRGFTRDDWKRLFQQAQIDPFSCRWEWAFRWLVIYSAHGREN